jgi:autotransporter translocation and assembly factor TamB
MSYLRMVAIAIGLCAVVLVLLSAANALVGVLRGSATGIGFVRRGVIVFLIGSVVLGWLTGTIWYLARR